MLHVWPPVGDGDLDLVRRNLTCGPVRYPPIFFYFKRLVSLERGKDG